MDAGVSGWKGDHAGDKGQLARFVSYVEDGTIKAGSVLIVESLDRLSREEVPTALLRFIQLLNKGIEIVTLMDSKVYKADGGTEQLIGSIFIMARAHEESAIKSKRLRDVYAKKHELARAEGKPMGNAKPMWLELSEDKKQYILRPDRAAIVRRVYQLAIDGYGKGASSKILNIEGVPSFKGKTWGASSLDKVLNNRAVLGEYQPYSVQVDHTGVRQKSGEVILDYYPAAIDESTFYQAKAAIEGRRKAGTTNQSKNFNVWQGVAKCALCGGAMHMVNKGKPPRGNTYLHCYRARKGLCVGKVVRLDKSEIVFKEVLTWLDDKSLIHDNSASIGIDIVVTEARLSEKKDSLEKYILLFTESPTSAVNALIVRTENEISELEKEEVALKASLASEKTISKEDFLEKLDLVSYEGRNRANTLLKKMCILVYIGKGYTVVVQQQDRQEALGMIVTENGVVASTDYSAPDEFELFTDIEEEAEMARIILNTLKNQPGALQIYDYKKS